MMLDECGISTQSRGPIIDPRSPSFSAPVIVGYRPKVDIGKPVDVWCKLNQQLCNLGPYVRMISIDNIDQAANRIRGSIVKTPTVHSARLSKYLKRTVVLKLENLQRSGSFKPRGVLNKLLTLSTEQFRQDICAVSGGNFGIALADVGSQLGASITIVLPKSAPEASATKIEDSGAKVIWTPNVAEAFSQADHLAAGGSLLVDDCDDPLIAAGSGTLALEMYSERRDLTDVFMSVGGGSMISGVASAFKHYNPKIRIWGVETRGADSMTCALSAGKPVTVDITSAVSTLGVPVVSEYFLDHVQALVHQMIVVTDQQALDGVVQFAELAGIWVEPAAGTLIAAMKNVADQLPESAVVGFVICGGNTTVDSVVSASV